MKKLCRVFRLVFTFSHNLGNIQVKTSSGRVNFYTETCLKFTNHKYKLQICHIYIKRVKKNWWSDFSFWANGVPFVIWCISVSVSRVTEGKLKYEEKTRSWNSEVFYQITFLKIRKKIAMAELFETHSNHLLNFFRFNSLMIETSSWKS